MTWPGAVSRGYCKRYTTGTKQLVNRKLSTDEPMVFWVALSPSTNSYFAFFKSLEYKNKKLNGGDNADFNPKLF